MKDLKCAHFSLMGCLHSADNINIFCENAAFLNSGNDLIMITPLSIDTQWCNKIIAFIHGKQFGELSMAPEEVHTKKGSTSTLKNGSLKI